MRCLTGRLRQHGLQCATGSTVPTVRKRAIYERAPARIFSREVTEMAQRCYRRSEAAAPAASRRAKPVRRHRPCFFGTDRELELRARERQRKLISKIDAALARLDDGTYGFCEETGEPISLRRLEARPIATLSVEAQERHERKEKLHRADD